MKELSSTSDNKFLLFSNRLHISLGFYFTKKDHILGFLPDSKNNTVTNN